MFGKHYESMYTGSLVGAGATVFAVWGYVIAHMKPPEFNVELNPRLLAFILGEPDHEVLAAIEKLVAPDPKSRTKVEDGRRLLQQGEYLYHVVNGEAYARVRTHADRQAVWREQKAKQREKVRGMEPPEPPPPALPTPEELAEADLKQPSQEALLQVEQDRKSMTQIELIYDHYPKKVGKPEALRAIKKALLKFPFDFVLDKTRRYAEIVKETNTDQRYVPHPATWYNNHRFNDNLELCAGITTRTISCSYGKKDEVAGTITPESVDVDVRFMPDGSVDINSLPKTPHDLYIAVQERLSELGLW